jgi:hypothetical protein
MNIAYLGTFWFVTDGHKGTLIPTFWIQYGDNVSGQYGQRVRKVQSVNNTLL